jgi:hypothetical protein
MQIKTVRNCYVRRVHAGNETQVRGVAVLTRTVQLDSVNGLVNLAINGVY